MKTETASKASTCRSAIGSFFPFAAEVGRSDGKVPVCIGSRKGIFYGSLFLFPDRLGAFNNLMPLLLHTRFEYHIEWRLCGRIRRYGPPSLYSRDRPER